MSSPTAALAVSAPLKEAEFAASMIPSELSQSPLLGIVGVLIGAGTVTLTSRMISLGMADYRGHQGFGFDDSAWISTAFDMGLMFIGPFIVYVGALLGPRRVLLIAAAVFTTLSIFLPLVHSYSLVIALALLAGLTSGTFYPLTLTFALRNIPLRFLPFTMALYATFIDGAVNIAPSLYGWYRSHLSWHWMFWNSAVITPVMMLCIFYGIPKLPPPRRSGPAPSFAGVLYAGAGLALMLAAFEQGQRLDWWRSGVYNALFWSGAFLVACAIIQRFRNPNPLVALPYLWDRNTALLGALLFWFRFSLVGTIILIPTSLAIRGFEADQIGPAIIWSAVPLLPIALIAGFLLFRNVDPRLIFAAGLTCTAAAALLNAQYDSAWAAANYYRVELLNGVGQSFALIGLVGCIILHGVFTGGLSKPQRILTFSAYFHTIRLFGGTASAVFVGHFVAEREKLHSNLLLGMHASRGNWITDWNIHAMTAGAFAKSSGLGAAASRAVDLIGMRARLQAYALAIVDGNYLLAWECACALLFVALLRKSPMFFGDLAGFQGDPCDRYSKLGGMEKHEMWIQKEHVTRDATSKEAKP
ncbi:MAG TPA: MFS transporter [Terriglobales bacterium]|nr:MFS transporter [Terriglobales bacterium]